MFQGRVGEYDVEQVSLNTNRHHITFTLDLKLISFTNPFLHSHSYSFRTDFTVLILYCIKGALALFFSFFFWLRVLDKAEYSAFESTLNSTIVSYRIVSYRIVMNEWNVFAAVEQKF